MRRDIEIDTSTNDVVLQNTMNYEIHSFEWVSEGDVYLFGQITIPQSFDVRLLQTEGVTIKIPYTPVYKYFKFKIIREFDNSFFVQNPANGSEWFEACSTLTGTTEPIRASQLMEINEDEYILQIDNTNGIGLIWPATNFDFVNADANLQNRDLLLQCVPTNNYRYPISGVGLVKYLHSNVQQTNLAQKLREEFDNDNVTVISAAFDSNTGQLDLELDFTKANENIPS